MKRAVFWVQYLSYDILLGGMYVSNFKRII